MFAKVSYEPSERARDRKAWGVEHMVGDGLRAKTGAATGADAYLLLHL